MAYPSVSGPYGLIPVKLLSGTPFVGGVYRQMNIASGYATSIFFGDAVKVVTGGTVERDTFDAAMTPVGVFMGCKYTDPNTGQLTFSQLWPANLVASDAMAYVVDDPSVLFAIQADGAPTNIGDIYGKNTLLVQTAPNTSLKISRVALDISEIGTDPENPIRIIDYLGGDQGDEKGTSFPILVCKFNYHQHTSTTGSA